MDDLRAAADAFNRFRRPYAQVRIVNAGDGTAVVEFLAEKEKTDSLVDYFIEKLESVTGGVVSIKAMEKNGSCVVTFAFDPVRNKGDDPTRRVMGIMDKYYEGINFKEFCFED